MTNVQSVEFTKVEGDQVDEFNVGNGRQTESLLLVRMTQEKTDQRTGWQ